MNISAFDVIYKEIVYKCVDMEPDWTDSKFPYESTSARPKFLNVTCIDSDGQVIAFHDKTFMFRFIRKAGDSHA